jgi:hypothetical protein
MIGFGKGIAGVERMMEQGQGFVSGLPSRITASVEKKTEMASHYVAYVMYNEEFNLYPWFIAN